MAYFVLIIRASNDGDNIESYLQTYIIPLDVSISCKRQGAHLLWCYSCISISKAFVLSCLHFHNHQRSSVHCNNI